MAAFDAEDFEETIGVISEETETDSDDWSLIRSIDGAHPLYEISHPQLGIFYSCDGGESFIRKDAFLYTVDDVDGVLYATFTPKSHWNDTGAIYDQHMSHWVEIIANAPLPYWFDLTENQENHIEFTIGMQTEAELRAELERLGFERDAKYDAFVTQWMTELG